MNKTCTDCRELKPLELYFKSKTGKFGRRSKCKVCFTKDTSIYQQCDKERTAGYSKKYNTANKEKLKVKRKLYDARTRVARTEAMRIYRAANKEKLDAYDKEYRLKNRSHTKKLEQAYLINNRGKVNAKQCKRYYGKKLRVPDWFEKDLIELVYAKCAEMVERDGIARDVDHVYPILGTTVSGLHVWENLQILDASTNRSKSNKHPDQMIESGWLY